LDVLSTLDLAFPAAVAQLSVGHEDEKAKHHFYLRNRFDSRCVSPNPGEYAHLEIGGVQSENGMAKLRSRGS
jgi:hypothetical protein